MTINDDRKELLKTWIKQLHDGANPEEMKGEFVRTFPGVSSTEIAQVEEELIKEGMPVEEVHRLCGVHLAAFKDAVDKSTAIAPEDHPIHTLMEEHRLLLDFAGRLVQLAGKMKDDSEPRPDDDKLKEMRHLITHLKESESHYLREENVLFPYLDKHGVTQPPKIMWMEHDRIRQIKKNICQLSEKFAELDYKEFSTRLNEAARTLLETLSSHFYKENNILFTVAMKVLTEDEWQSVRRQFDELGYCCFTPGVAAAAPEMRAAPAVEQTTEGVIRFDTGKMSLYELTAVLNTLPVDITFIDKDDTVRYFNQTRDRIFPRAVAVLGLRVQQCHPQKSLHLVNRILEDFRSGRKDAAEFWIHLGERFVHIRYFAVRGKDGEYLGCMEVTQDIAPIQKIEGEKRLL